MWATRLKKHRPDQMFPKYSMSKQMKPCVHDSIRDTLPVSTLSVG